MDEESAPGSRSPLKTGKTDEEDVGDNEKDGNEDLRDQEEDEEEVKVHRYRPPHPGPSADQPHRTSTSDFSLQANHLPQLFPNIDS
ncbi:hypothetical protein BT69DRAFT_1282874 [Atractiella rhizophila]|nr:hypothetical protein BT69DRAFT_1282874 [Atractiella rhizophila]